MRNSILFGCALAPLLLAGAAQAQSTEIDGPIATASTTVEELVVNGTIVFRDRTAEPNPVLAYDLEYFQRFEPLSVGEMLKRVPGATFTSDVLEFDGVSLRGLPPGYTQILINGRRAPGGEADRSFFVDRIPAELVERIEIIRSPRADEPSEGIGGTLNIVLKESAAFEGGFVKAGALMNDDGKVRPSAAIAYADTLGDTSYWAALNYQGRRNPKEKVSERFFGAFATPKDSELQSDTRDGADISGNAEITHRWDGGRLRLNGFFVDTDRDEDETSLTYGDDGEDLDVLKGVEIQRERISQQTYSLTADAEFEIGPGRLELRGGWNGYREDTTAETDEGDDLSEVELDEHVELDITDDEWTAGAAYVATFGGLRAKVGVDYLSKTRDGAEVEFDVDDGEVGDPDPEPGAVFDIEERRVDPYVRLTFDPSPQLTIDAGLRLETTDRTVTSDLGSVDFDDQSWNPSAHLTWRVTSTDQIRASIARTVRRPDYDLLAPYIAFEEPADEDALRGNPLLENETAWGLDLGYEHRIGRRGVVGVNFFYRDIDRLIEVVNAGADVREDEEDPDSDVFNLYEPRNIGSGKTWGMELDLSTPLDMVGLPDTGVFFNFTWMDSEVTDPFTGNKRRFTNQPHYVYNIGVIHTVPAWDVSFGASYYDRGAGYEYGLDETVTVDYDGNLEAFVEKRFGKRFVVRVAATNILDMEKREDFLTYAGDSAAEIIANRRAGIVDESERERERSGPLYQLTLRAAF
jgi:outer membrane receptor for ferrienterochelin and colicins